MTTHTVVCHCCGLIQEHRPLHKGEVARCSRCRTVVARAQHLGHNGPAAAAALAALILYPFAIGLPVMAITKLGHSHEASIWNGAISLLSHGEILIGLVVIVCSVIIPLGKLLGILALSLEVKLHDHHLAFTYRLIELLGRWGMVDVLLVAVLVAILKLGDLVSVEPGLGVMVFTIMVICSLISSAWFDPHVLWKTKNND